MLYLDKDKKLLFRLSGIRYTENFTFYGLLPETEYEVSSQQTEYGRSNKEL